MISGLLSLVLLGMAARADFASPSALVGASGQLLIQHSPSSLPVLNRDDLPDRPNRKLREFLDENDDNSEEDPSSSSRQAEAISSLAPGAQESPALLYARRHRSALACGDARVPLIYRLGTLLI